MSGMVVPAGGPHGGGQPREEGEGALALEGLAHVRGAEGVHAAVGHEGRAAALGAGDGRQHLIN